MSAGLLAEETCHPRDIQLVNSVNLCISPTRFATNTDHFRDGEVIQFNATMESDHKNIFTSVTSNDDFILSINCASNNAAKSSRHGKEIALIGATRDLEQSKYD